MDYDELMTEAKEYLTKRDFEQAEELYSAAIQKNDQESLSWNYLGYVQGLMKKHDESENTFNHVVKTLDPENHYAWNGLGLAFLNQAKLTRAIKAFRMSIRYGKGKEHPWLNLAITLEKQGKHDSAEQTLKKALKIMPQNKLLQRYLARFYYRKGDYGFAESEYRKLIEISDFYADHWSGLGDSLRQQDRLEEAETAYLMASENYPEYDRPWIELGQLQISLDKHDDALNSFIQATIQNPWDDLPWHSIGYCKAILGDQDGAETAYIKTLWLSPEDKVAWLNLGICLNNQSRMVEAEAALKEALRLDPDYEPSWSAMANAIEDQGRHVEAVEAFLKCPLPEDVSQQEIDE